MSNPVIQQTLIDLQESLLKIESARTQVNNVTEKSEQIISSFNKILISIESISDGVGIDKESIKRNLNESFNNFQNELDIISQKSDKSIKKVNEDFNLQKTQFKENLENNITSINEEFNKLSTNIELITNDVKKELVKLSSEFNDGLSDINSKLEKFKINLIEAEKRIQDLNFKDEFKTLSILIEKKQKQTILLIGICTVILIAFIYIF
jgi:hypothetical protein